VAGVPSSSRGGGGPQTVYVSDDDPGEVGFGVVWIDTSLNDSEAPVLKVRNDANDDWDSQLALFSNLATEGLYLTGRPGEAGLTSNIRLSRTGLTTIRGRDGVADDGGGAAVLTGGHGDDGTTNGAAVYADAGSSDGVTHGKLSLTTEGTEGTAGQVLTADGAGFATWEDPA
jgi:hypothetical protein